MLVSEMLIALKERFPDGIVRETACCGQHTIEVSQRYLLEILSYLKTSPECGYEVLMDLTGVDYLEPVAGTHLVYWLHHPVNYQRIRVVHFVQRGHEIPSVVGLWEGADWYERELFDLFGVRFEGHPDMKRILLPDDWVGHPLRKDYQLTEEPVEFKHGVKPKVPSQIIQLKRNQKY